MPCHCLQLCPPLAPAGPRLGTSSSSPLSQAGRSLRTAPAGCADTEAAAAVLYQKGVSSPSAPQLPMCPCDGQPCSDAVPCCRLPLSQQRCCTMQQAALSSWEGGGVAGDRVSPSLPSSQRMGRWAGAAVPLALLGPLPRRRQHTGLCSLSADQPDAELPVPQQALASISHEYCLHHPSVLPILPGCSRLPLLHHLVVSTRWTTA